MVNIAVVYHSQYGHTKAVAEAVARGAASVAGASVELVSADDLPAPDKDRKLGGKWPVLSVADAIIFGCPTYMGSISAGLKRVFEASSGLWMQQAWKDKVAAGFTNSGSWHGDKLNTLQDVVHFAMQHGMIWVGLDLLPGANSSKGSPTDLNRIGSSTGVMTQSNVDQGPDVAPPENDRKTAERLGQRVAEATLRWKRGG
ncbi:MAG: flavodoxin family protein [Phycisphaerales bacterium]|nr:flavodoxin family protein [Phycisphaerales bacterium]